MLTSQRLQLELSELRNRVNGLAGEEDFNADELEGLNTKYRNTEIRFQSALIQEAAEKEESPDSDVDGEIFEIRELRHNVNTAAYIYAALQDQPLEGREKELNDALKLAGAGTVMPMAALLSNEDRLELRAATNAPSDSDVIVQQILEVWPESHWPGFALPKTGVLQSYTSQ